MLGYSADDHFELGIVPLLALIPAGAKLVAARIRAAQARTQAIRAAAKQHGVPAWRVREELRKMRKSARAAGRPWPPRPPPVTTQSAPTSHASTASTRNPPRFLPFTRRPRAVAGVMMPRGRRLQRRYDRLMRRAGRRGVQLGPRHPGGGPSPRCVLLRGDDGMTYAVDEFGNAALVTQADEDLYGADGYDDMGDDYDDMGDDYDDMGADYDDDMGADEDESEDDEIMGQAEEAADELASVVAAPQEVYGAAEDRLQRRIDRIARHIERIQDKPLRAPFRRAKAKRRKRRMSRLRDRRKRLIAKLRRITGQRRQEIAAVAGVAAGVGAASGLGMALWSRQGQQERVQQGSQLYDPRFANQVRVNQHRAGLQGNYVAPPGSGRLNRVPMFASGSEDNPRNALTVPVAGITAGLELVTEDLPYVLVKLVGFKAALFGTAAENNAIGLVEDLKIKGGTNLFLHEGPANAAEYAAANDDELVGLRSYPNIRSPNQAFVTVKAAGDLDDVVVITASVVVDILEDDTYGAGFAGPYAG